MSGWPKGAVDSERCSADVLTGSGPFAHTLTPSLFSLQNGQGWREWVQVKLARWWGEAGKGSVNTKGAKD